MRIKRAAVIGLLLLGVLAPGCSEDKANQQPVLVVQAASEQPGADALGVIVVIQSRGGTWLEVQVSGGTLANGARGTCLRAPTAESLRESTINVLVFPARAEAVVTVSLFSDGPRTSKHEADAGQAGTSQGLVEVGPCQIEGTPLKQVIRPVQRIQPTVPASGGAVGAGGVGGNAVAGSGAVAGDAGSAGAAGSGGSAGESDGGAGAAGDSNPEGGGAGSPSGAGSSSGGTSGLSGTGGAL